MTTYHLVLESGPQRKRTYVHVLQPLGCNANGPTTEAALERAPDAIREFLRLLAGHGEEVGPGPTVELEVVRHDTASDGMGNLLLDEDREPLPRAELERYVRWAQWLREDLLALVEPLSDEAFEAKPERGRPIRRIMEHVFGAEYSYVRRWGKIPEVPGPGKPERMTRDELMSWMAHVHAREIDQLLDLTDEQLSAVMPAGSRWVSARRTMRKVVGHQWEHLVEIRQRLGS